MLSLSNQSRSHRPVVGLAARKAAVRGKDSPTFFPHRAALLGKSFIRNGLRHEISRAPSFVGAAAERRNAIERQGGRCYTPAALKVAAAFGPPLQRHTI